MKKTTQNATIKEVQSYLKEMGVKTFQAEIKCYDGKISVITDKVTGRKIKDFFLSKGFKRSKRDNGISFSKAIESV